MFNARTILLACILLGTATGLGMTWSKYRYAPVAHLPTVADHPALESSLSPPRLEVDAREFDFGKVERGTVIRHDFVFTNHGPGPLRLAPGATTCSACTIAEFETSQIEPGESARVTVQYDAKSVRSAFRQTATVLTNDPRMKRVELTISGTISTKFYVHPSPVEMGNVAAGDTARATTQLLYLLDGELTILDHSFEDASTAKLFSLVATPLSPEAAAESGATSGYELVLSLKPGLPLGAFQQTIRLKLKQEPGALDVEEVFGVNGTIVSDFSIVGPGWRSDRSILNLGTVRASQGLNRKLTLLVRGASRQNLQLSVGRVDPPAIQVRLGERKPLGDAVDQIPLEIEIPPGLPPMIRLGTDQGAFGEIELAVENHPDVKAFPIKLQFAVQ